MLRWEAAGEAPVRGSRLEAGQALVLERGETSVLRFDELDATLEVSGPALVRLGAAAVDGRSEPVAHVDVRLGRVWVRGADASQLLLASRWTTARSFKGAEVLFALETGSAADLPQSRAELAAWFEQVPQLPPAELDFEIAVERGEAQVTYGTYAEMLGSGARRRPRTRPTLPRQVGLDDENRLRGLVQSLVEGGRLAGLGNAWAFERNVERRIALSGAIEADARRWEIVGPLIYEQFQADKTDNEARLWLLDLLAWDRLPASLELAEELWMAAPEVFNDELLVSLAERGGWAFEQELRAIAESARVEPLRRARALAYLAPRSESAARQSLLNELDAALARTLEIGGLVGGLQVRQALAAAGVLALLGQPDRFDALVGRAATDAEYALEGRSDPKDAVDGARRQVLFLEFYRDWVKRAYEADSIPQLGFVEERAWAYVMGRQGLTTPAELRARLLELRQPLRLR